MVEAAAELRQPFCRCMVRRMRRAGCEIEEKRLVRRGRMLGRQPADRLVGNGAIEEEIGIVMRRFDRARILDQAGIPLAGIGREEAVEILETQPGRPTGEWACLAGFPFRRQVGLADHRGVVAIVAQDPRHRSGRRRNYGGIAFVAGRDVGDISHPCVLRNASREQRGASGRAQCGGVEPVVADTVASQRIESAGGNRPPESAARPEADVIGENDKHIGRASRGDRIVRPLGRAGFRGGSANLACLRGLGQCCRSRHRQGQPTDAGN